MFRTLDMVDRHSTACFVRAITRVMHRRVRFYAIVQLTIGCTLPPSTLYRTLHSTIGRQSTMHRGAQLQLQATHTPFSVRPASAGGGPLTLRDVNQLPLSSRTRPAKNGTDSGTLPLVEHKKHDNLEADDQLQQYRKLRDEYKEKYAVLARTLRYPPKHHELTGDLRSMHDTLAEWHEAMWPGQRGSPSAALTPEGWQTDGAANPPPLICTPGDGSVENRASRRNHALNAELAQADRNQPTTTEHSSPEYRAARTSLAARQPSPGAAPPTDFKMHGVELPVAAAAPHTAAADAAAAAAASPSSVPAILLRNALKRGDSPNAIVDATRRTAPRFAPPAASSGA